MLRPSRRADALVFSLVLLATGYFHQGGGWNQNARFALVRSIVEQRSFFIDSYLIYDKAADSNDLVRLPLRDANFERGGTRFALAWRSPAGSPVAIDPQEAGSRRLIVADDVAASGDIAYFDGHFHPNKAPGTSFLAVPGYALIQAIDSVLGINPDSWAALTRNAWLTSLLSVGLVTALAAVLVLRLARGLASELAARLAALSFALATMALPYGTMLFEHNVIAAALIAALYAIEKKGSDLIFGETGFDPFSGAAAAGGPGAHAAGIFAGFAAITNYTMALLVPAFAAYLFVRRRRPADLAWFGAGVAWPLAAICAYNLACFGTAFTTNYAYQSTMFTAADRVLGVFAMPRLDVFALLLVSPYRGLFYTSPVLLAAVAAMFVLWRNGRTRALAALAGGAALFLLLVNSSFNGWDAGWTAVPRYLGPAMALLALPLAVAFDRWRPITCGLAACSLVIQLLMTVVDPQVPIGDAGQAGIPVSEVFTTDPMTRYVLPLFVYGRAWPILDDSIDQLVSRASQVAAGQGQQRSAIESKADELRADLRARIDNGEGTPLPLGAVAGPVSANPIGVYEGYYYRLFPAGSRQAAGNSFNLGELVFEQSRLSLLPLLLLGGALAMLLFQSDDEEATPSPATGAAQDAPKRKRKGR